MNNTLAQTMSAVFNDTLAQTMSDVFNDTLLNDFDNDTTLTQKLLRLLDVTVNTKHL